MSAELIRVHGEFAKVSPCQIRIQTTNWIWLCLKIGYPIYSKIIQYSPKSDGHMSHILHVSVIIWVQNYEWMRHSRNPGIVFWFCGWAIIWVIFPVFRHALHKTSSSNPSKGNPEWKHHPQTDVSDSTNKHSFFFH